MPPKLGPFGFLAGTTVEKEGLSNVGLYDQRAVLKWIRRYIGLVGGDKHKVSAWGLSAGGSSITHHLTAFGGTQDPLFSRAVIQSPGDSPFSVDRKGALEDTFRDFAARAGCTPPSLTCLRSANTAVLSAAGLAAINASIAGAATFGVASDGKWVRQSATLELASGGFDYLVNAFRLSST